MRRYTITIIQILSPNLLSGVTEEEEEEEEKGLDIVHIPPVSFPLIFEFNLLMRSTSITATTAESMEERDMEEGMERVREGVMERVKERGMEEVMERVREGVMEEQEVGYLQK